MPLEIRPTRRDDLPALSRFLAWGFHLDPDAEPVALDVLAWKYLEPPPKGLGCGSLLALDEHGDLAGHLGFTRTCWLQAGCAEKVSTLHMLDWLAGPGHKGVGSRLMRRASAEARSQYGLGGSRMARALGPGLSYLLRDPVPVFLRILRPSWRLRESGRGLGSRLTLTVRDALRMAKTRPSKPSPAVSIRPVERFGPEIETLIDRTEPPLMFSDRGFERLNGVLNYPRGGPQGLWIERDGSLEGFAITNVVPKDRVKIGKIVEIFLSSRDEDAWSSALAHLTNDLKGRGADVAVAVGNTDWEARALERSGFRRAYDLDFQIRDRDGLLPESVPTHLSFLEADYATLA
jgi:hypothetical protein